MNTPSSAPDTLFPRAGRLATVALAALVVFGGCSSGVKLDDKAPVESATPKPVASDSSMGKGMAESTVAPVDLNSSRDTSGLAKIIYFDFDSYVVKDEFRPVVESNAKVLTNDHGKKVSVQGYTDERGGSEYNLALGQKRAEAVSKSLQLLGVSGSQVEAVSFGKERPAVEGNDESAWAKNRRVELAYK